MDFLGFTLNVWTAIAAGLFFLFMVFSCTLDRNSNENAKWIVLIVGLVVFGFWQRDAWQFKDFLTAAFWKPAGIYLAIGLAYAMLEFFFQVRREARYWSQHWNNFKAKDGQREPFSGRDKSHMTLEQRFFDENKRSHHRSKLVNIEINAEGSIEPTVNRRELAESISCWTLLWPAYAVSLVLGDILTGFFRRMADLFAMLSRGFIRRAFAKVFTP